MEGWGVLIGMDVICWVCAVRGFRKRRELKQMYREVPGRVMSFETEPTGGYHIEVNGTNGKRYSLFTENRAAKKYKDKEDIVLLEFKGFEIDSAQEVQAQLEESERCGTLGGEEQELLKSIREANEKIMSVGEKLQNELPVQLKEDIHSTIPEIVVGIVFGVIFTSLTVLGFFVNSLW